MTMLYMVVWKMIFLYIILDIYKFLKQTFLICNLVRPFIWFSMLLHESVGLLKLENFCQCIPYIIKNNVSKWDFRSCFIFVISNFVYSSTKNTKYNCLLFFLNGRKPWDHNGYFYSKSDSGRICIANFKRNDSNLFHFIRYIR